MKPRKPPDFSGKKFTRRGLLEWLGKGCVLALEPKTILAYGIGGSTLPLKHGFPLRIVIPRLYGYKSAKYVERIELTDRPFGGYWVAYGYPYDGEVSQSRLRPGKY